MNPTPPESPAVRRTAIIIKILVILFLLFDVYGKVMKLPPILKACAQLGIGASLVFGIGATLLAVTVLYVIPATSIFGAVLLTGYLGGAIVTQLLAHNPVFECISLPVLFAVLAWAPLYLREPALRQLVPLRKP